MHPVNYNTEFSPFSSFLSASTMDIDVLIWLAGRLNEKTVMVVVVFVNTTSDRVSNSQHGES